MISSPRIPPIMAGTRTMLPAATPFDCFWRSARAAGAWRWRRVQVRVQVPSLRLSDRLRTEATEQLDLPDVGGLMFDDVPDDPVDRIERAARLHPGRGFSLAHLPRQVRVVEAP